MPTAKECRSIAAVANRQVELVRKRVRADREMWPNLCLIPGVNKRWLRAFVSKQIAQPPAGKFLAINVYLGLFTKK